MIRRLRIKFVCINMAIVTAMLLVIFGMVLHFTGENLRRQSIRAMDMAVQNHIPPVRPGEGPDKPFFSGFVLEIGSTGTLTVRSGEYYDLSDESLLWRLADMVNHSEERMGVLADYKLRYMVHTTPAGKRIVFADISAEMETVKNLVKSCVLIGLLSLTAFLAISVFLANWAVRPVEKAWNQQRQFVADASHELKTPLSVIMTNAELLQSGDYPQEERALFSRNILTVTLQMRTLVESLLGLARVDNGSAKLDFVKLNLSELMEDSLLRFEPVYFEKGRFLQGEIEANLLVKGNPDYLRQVVDILLDNGSKYAALDSTVRARLTRQGNQCLLSVASRGEPISKADLKNIFKRFYRVDKVRSRDGSYGLGLAIAESIVSEHRGKIWAESHNGINTFFVQLALIS